MSTHKFRRHQRLTSEHTHISLLLAASERIVDDSPNVFKEGETVQTDNLTGKKKKINFSVRLCVT